MTPKQIIVSWDFLVTLVITIVLFIVIENQIPSEFAKDIYGVGISVLSIVFSVYFAALALIITSGDDDFVHFLEEEGDYTGIISTFKFSLLALFLALAYSIAAYAFTSARIVYGNNLGVDIVYQPRILITFFVFLFSYGLLAALRATLDSITYALFRVKFLRSRPRNSDKKNHHE